MLDAARKATALASGKVRDDLDEDDVLQLALTRLVEIIGEASKNVSEGFRSAHPEIPWKPIAGTRDKLIHGYFDVDHDVLWGIISRDLPPLIRQLESLVS
jgi:uncharacterized protein with HEPN domain